MHDRFKKTGRNLDLVVKQFQNLRSPGLKSDKVIMKSNFINTLHDGKFFLKLGVVLFEKERMQL